MGVRVNGERGERSGDSASGCRDHSVPDHPVREGVLKIEP